MSVRIRFEHVCDCCHLTIRVEEHDINIHMPAQDMQWPRPNGTVGWNVGPYHVCDGCFKPIRDAYIEQHRKHNGIFPSNT